MIRLVVATLGKVVLEVDAAQTRQIYNSIEGGGAKHCGCAYCRNFIAQLPDLFPKDVLAFLEKCGIDISKDAEIYQFGETPPGFYSYGGEYYFICSKPPAVDADVLPNGFQFTITLPTPIVPDEFRNVPGARCFSFTHEIPWILQENP